MRQLTILREKTFVGSLSRVKVYAEDAAASELTINGVPCRKLGELKNGEQKTFEIGEETMKIFVIAGKLSKGFCSDYFVVPEGSEQVFLSGKCRLNPGAGNAFRFNDNMNSEALSNRKRGTIRGTAFLIPAVIAAMIGGFFFGRALVSSDKNDPKEFADQGMHITLTKAFTQEKVEPYTVSFSSKAAVIHIMREDFSLAEGFGDISLNEYADFVRQSNPQIGESVSPGTGDGFLYYEYSYQEPSSQITYRYFVSMYKASDAFWVFNFVTEQSIYEELRPQFLQWSESVRFDMPAR